VESKETRRHETGSIGDRGNKRHKEKILEWNRRQGKEWKGDRSLGKRGEGRDT
jgi:hypothetical protein